MIATIRRFSSTLSLLGLLALGCGTAAASTQTLEMPAWSGFSAIDTDTASPHLDFSTPGPAAAQTMAAHAVAVVPLPPSVWLFISGLGSLALLKMVRVNRQRQNPRSHAPSAD